MPFSKWNLEPVFVSRGQPWCTLRKPIANTAPKASPLSPSFTLLPNGKNVPPTNEQAKYDQEPSHAVGKPHPDCHDNLVMDSTPQVNGISSSLTNGKEISSMCDVMALSPIANNNTSDQADHIEVVNCKPHPAHHNTECSFTKVAKVVSNGPTGEIIHSETMANDEQILMKIQCRTMVSVIKQMAALLTASDQMFSELTDECRRIVDRTVQLRVRVAKISRHVDRLNVLMRQKG